MDSDNLLKKKHKAQEKYINKLYTRKILGYILLVFVILITVLSSIWIQDISSGVNSFLLTYINYSFLTPFILLYYLKQTITKRFNREDDTVTGESNTPKPIIQDSVFYIMCIVLTVFWYFGNCFYNLGLTKTSITSGNALSNAAILFILFMKVTIFKKKCTLYKVIGVLLFITGISLMTYFDSEERKGETKGSISGDICIVIGSLFYSFYATALKYFSKRYKAFDMMLVFGYIGLFNMLLMPVVILILHLTGFEDFVLPSWQSILYIFINALVAGYISDFFMANAIILLAPHIVSFGLTITIPLSYLFDFYYGNVEFSVLYLISSVLIFSSCSVIFAESYMKYAKKKKAIEDDKREVIC
jgi:drug/metabolite transporter (DMT)-like permease